VRVHAICLVGLCEGASVRAWPIRSGSRFNSPGVGTNPAGWPRRGEAYDEFHDLAKPHRQTFMVEHNPIAAQMRATTWELGVAGLIPR